MNHLKAVCPQCKFPFAIAIPFKLPRSQQQNKYYWGCVVDIPAREIGYTSEEMHEAYKWMFLRMHEEGRPETVRSTTSLNTAEFKEYIDKCVMWCAEQGFVIPDATSVIEEETK